MKDLISFGKQLKIFREKHFPGKSLRSVGDELDMGDTFYTYLSKMENDTLLPSEAVLFRLMGALSLTDTEKTELLTSFFATKINRSTLITRPLSHETANLLFRKITKDNKK
jgi:transcriptional regulator with XRE-family HTH domain